jgi:hypothetical protein
MFRLLRVTSIDYISQIGKCTELERFMDLILPWRLIGTFSFSVCSTANSKCVGRSFKGGPADFDLIFVTNSRLQYQRLSPFNRNSRRS